MPADTLQLRPLQFSDNAFVSQVFASVLPLYRDLMPGVFEANLENMQILSQKGLDFQATGLLGELISVGPEPVGFLAVGPLNARQAYMAALHFLAEHQRKGYGSRALQQLEPYYRSKGFQEMLLLAHHQADWAVKFYQRNAYQIVAEQELSILTYGGEGLKHLWQPGLILMAKKL